MELTQEYIKQALNYDPDTGRFTWVKTRSRGAIAGTVAGSVTSHGYIEIGLYRKRYYAHRLAWLVTHGYMPSKEIDHIDGDTKNNAISNLREVDRSNNCRNMKKRLDNTSGISGVCWDKNNEKWMVRIGRTMIGRYKSKSDAIAARKAAEVDAGYHKNHGRHC